MQPAARKSKQAEHTMTKNTIAHHLAQRTLELVRLPSVTGDEGTLCTHVFEWLHCHLPDAQIQRVGDNLLVSPPPSGDRPTIGLFGHLDTVPPSADQPVAILDERVYGCGASDMKGGLAVMLALLEAVPRFQANLVGVFYAREEGPADASGLVELLAAGVLPSLDLALCLEPTDNELHGGCMGGLHARVRIQGRRAHSARPWFGDNALYRALPMLARIRDVPDRSVDREGLTFVEVMNVTMMHTVDGRNVIPGLAELNVNYRFAPGRSPEDAETVLRSVVSGPQPEVEFPDGMGLEIIDVAPPGQVCVDHPLLRAWRKEFGPKVRAKQAWTDVARLTEAGIPAVNFGPGETALAHQARESVAISALERNHQMLVGLLEGVLTG